MDANQSIRLQSVFLSGLGFWMSPRDREHSSYQRMATVAITGRSAEEMTSEVLSGLSCCEWFTAFEKLVIKHLQELDCE